MIIFAQLITFLIPTLVLNVTPGPDLLYVFGHSIKGGPKAARDAAFGVWVGYLVHVALVGFGIATVLQASPFIFKSVKFAGAIYLLWPIP